MPIIFVPRNDNLPPDWSPGVHWTVEFWSDTHDCSRPLGVAYVSDFSDPGNEHPDKTYQLHQYVDYIIVCDDCRRQGVATALVKAIKERWPNAELTDAISPEGEAFLDSLDAGE